MTGKEFRALMAAAGLSVRAAARLLDVDPTTIQRWRNWPDARSPIPYWAVATIRHLAPETTKPAPPPKG